VANLPDRSDKIRKTFNFFYPEQSMSEKFSTVCGYTQEELTKIK
jgi:hypothetical protein